MLVKFIKNHKKVFLFFLMSFVVIGATFAQSSADSAMEEQVGKIVNFFSSGWVKGICCILLIGECLGLLFAGGQNPQIFKKFLPFIIGTVLFMCAGKIINIIWGSGIEIKKDLSMIESPVLTLEHNIG